ncbi:MAG: hypothetical protein K0R26_1930 [Bacteroidota bacterium]|jgi:hypothetical protein|nr:hypothetical protein [Bacteroidota bacterium]
MFFLVIDNCFPTVHKTIKEMKAYRKHLVDDYKEPLTAMYCKYTPKSFENGFSNEKWYLLK